MATTVVLTSVVKPAQPGPVYAYVNFADGTQLEFASLADLTAWAQEPDGSVGLTQRLCVAYALARSSDLSNVASVAGKNFIFDLSAAAPIKVQ